MNSIYIFPGIHSLTLLPPSTPPPLDISPHTQDKVEIISIINIIAIMMIIITVMMTKMTTQARRAKLMIENYYSNLLLQQHQRFELILTYH